MAPSPQERFKLAEKHAILLRALMEHDGFVTLPDGQPDRARINPTLFNVVDFEMTTYISYILPLLPPDAMQCSRALAIKPVRDFDEKPDKMADNLYPRMQGRGLMEKWGDVVTRGVMLQMIITIRAQQAMVGGPFDFSSEVQTAARAMLTA